MRLKRFLIRSISALAILVILGLASLYFAYQQNLYVGNTLAQEEVFIHGGVLFDALDTQPVANPGIILSNGKIACIGRSCEPSRAAIRVDASNYSILPGLIELHGHFFARTRDDAQMSIPAFIWNTARAKPDVRRKLLEAGVTSFRSLGDPRDVILTLKADIERGDLAGPRLYAAGPIFTAPGGHPAYEGRDPNIGGVGGAMVFQSDDPVAIVAEMASLWAQGADGVKAVLHGSLAEDGEVLLPTISIATLKAISAQARKNGQWVAVHVGQTSAYVIEAVRAGATTIEHGVRGGNLISEEALQLLVSEDIVYVPTLGREPLGHLNIPALYAAGVTIGVGTDTNNTEMSYGESYHEELARLVDAGLPAPAAIVAATRNGAKALGRLEALGTIEVGKEADLILVAGTPWLDIAALKSVELVFQAGRLVVDKR